MDYTWNYGVGNPNNYSLPDVKWNMRFRNHYYIHSAYWHNNFGQPMSHGCVNTSIPDAEWIYSWADVGTTVEIKN
jgi:lipoprotein-anchoring transpeptidase ErfK/SrfK